MSSSAGGFTVGVSQFRDTPTSPDLLRDIQQILESGRALDRLPSCRELVVELEEDVPAGATLIRAHRGWLPMGFSRLTTPSGLPRQPNEIVCPAGLVRVSIRCVRRWTPGMGSHYGFRGRYWSVLIHVREREIWDVRAERAE
jgi:hypothetical protein